MRTKHQPLKRCKKHRTYQRFYRCAKHKTFPRLQYPIRPLLGDTPFHERRFMEMWSLEGIVRTPADLDREEAEKLAREMRKGHQDCFYREHSDLQSCKCPLSCEYCFAQNP